MESKLALVICSAALLLSCASGPIVPILLRDKGEVRLKKEHAVPVALSPSDRERLDPYVMAFFGTAKQPVFTGEIWARAFTGDPQSDPVLTIQSAELREAIAGAGFTIRYTYTAKATLLCDEKSIPITATGSRAAAMNTFSAMRQAVELGVLDAAVQSKSVECP